MLALDYGERRVGVAVSDPEGVVALGVEGLLRRDDRSLCEEVRALVERYDAGLLVVGDPLSLSGKAGPQARRVGRFVRALRKVLARPVVTWDERFSSVEAGRRVREGGRKGAKGDVDRVAATLILQSYLDSGRMQSDMRQGGGADQATTSPEDP